jgi:decaprenyl-phosphate phosphoribosyltransferase
VSTVAVSQSKSPRVYLEALRPPQWIKNTLVLAAPLAAGEIFEQKAQVTLAVVSFVFASSFGYLVNDWIDREFDQIHPTKKRRPFASGRLEGRHFIMLLLLCGACATLPLMFLPSPFALTLVSYLCLTLSYSLVIKNLPVLEMFWLALGFLIRGLAGSTLIDESPTGWFVITIFFGSLFLVSTKRRAEIWRIESNSTRRVIDKYTREFISSTLLVSMSITILVFGLWVYESHPHSIFAQISFVSFAFSMFMYLYLCDKGDAETPEKLLFSNRILLLSFMLTFSLLLVVFYL